MKYLATRAQSYSATVTVGVESRFQRGNRPQREKMLTPVSKPWVRVSALAETVQELPNIPTASHAVHNRRLQ
jgi:hypothetical protein